MSATGTGSVDSPKDFGRDSEGKAKRWRAEIDNARKESTDWWRESERILHRYRDDAPGRLFTRGEDMTAGAKFGIFWSNVQTLLPSLYASTPQVVIERRWSDDSDDVGRVATTILQRCTQFQLDEGCFDRMMRECVLDHLLCGRGTPWVRYEPHFMREPPGTPPFTQPATPPSQPGLGGIPVGSIFDQPGDDANAKAPKDSGVQLGDDGEMGNEVVAYEEVKIDHVFWEDWLCSPARTWAEVRWVARRVFPTYDELVQRFGRELADLVPLDYAPKDSEETGTAEPEHNLFHRSQVWEIWDKPSRQAIWLAPSLADRLLDERDDPLRLQDFFPTPCPLFATMTTDTLIPVPDYTMYRDQAVQLDKLTARIEAISRSIKVTGVYDAAQDGIQRMFTEGIENQLVPVNQWGAFAQQGGLKGSLDMLDISTLASVLQQLVQTRSQVKQDMYEITGISDIIRGATNAAETATAQQIKAGFGTMRLRARQNEVARFARDIIRLVAEVICEHFTPRTMLLLSDIQNYGDGSDAQLAGQAIALLKDDKTRPLRIDIETDSTILANQQQEQQSRIQFLQMAGQFLQQSLPAAQQSPQLAPLLGEMLLFGIRSFPQGAALESAFESAVKQMEQAAKQAQANPQPQPQDPKMIVAQAQVRNIDSQIQDRQIRSVADAQDAQAEARYRAAKLGVEKQRADDDNAARSVELFHNREADHRDFVLDAARVGIEAEKARRK